MLRAVAREIRYQIRWALPIWFLWLFTTWWPNNRITIRIRGMLYRPFFKRCGKNLQLAAGVQFLNSHEIVIGDNVYIAYYAWMNGLGGITIEDEVVIGPYVAISSLAHVRHNGSYRFGGAQAAPIHIGRGSWLASHVAIAHGVSIGKGCLVAANAVVTKDVVDNKMVGGVPARIIGDCQDQEATLMSRSGWKTSA